MDTGEIHLEKNWLATLLINMGYSISLVMLELGEGKKLEVEVDMNISN